MDSSSTYDRTHSHTLDGGATWVECSTLTHCPSICSCPIDECDATEIVR